MLGVEEDIGGHFADRDLLFETPIRIRRADGSEGAIAVVEVMRLIRLGGDGFLVEVDTEAGGGRQE
jgi:hypothetical protein